MKALLLISSVALLAVHTKIPLTNFIDLTFSDKTSTDPISLSIDEVFTVQLMETPSTGYLWQLSDIDLKENGLTEALELIQMSFSSDSDGSQRGAIGVEGFRTLRYRCIASANGNLNIFLARASTPRNIDNDDANFDLDFVDKKTIPLTCN